MVIALTLSRWPALSVKFLEIQTNVDVAVGSNSRRTGSPMVIVPRVCLSCRGVPVRCTHFGATREFVILVPDPIAFAPGQAL